MKNYQEALKEGYALLKEVGIESFILDTQIILERVTKRDRSYFYAHPEALLTEEEIKQFNYYLNRRIKREPIAQIFKNKEFMGLEFEVNKHVLTPRPDTEILVEAVLEEIGEKGSLKILDLCTGSGAIGLSLKKYKNNQEITLSDISLEALEVAKRNAGNFNIKVNFICSDLFNQIKDSFDIIVSNPPYIESSDIEKLEPEIKDWEPIIALDGGADGYYFYRSIISQSKKHLNENGKLFLEIGYNQSNYLKTLLEKHGFRDIKIIKDLSGINRVISGTI